MADGRTAQVWTLHEAFAQAFPTARCARERGRGLHPPATQSHGFTEIYFVILRPSDCDSWVPWTVTYGGPESAVGSEMGLRVLMLDVDGVITLNDGSGRLDDLKLEKLERVARATECVVCISSNWRHFHQLAVYQSFSHNALVRPTAAWSR